MVVNDMSQKRSVTVSKTISEGADMEEHEGEMQIEKEEETEEGSSRERVLHMEGDMEKKSPAHNLWQGRYFKLMTKQRESVSGE